MTLRGSEELVFAGGAGLADGGEDVAARGGDLGVVFPSPRRSNSAARFPAKIGWVCASTKPGMTRRWPASITSCWAVMSGSISERELPGLLALRPEGSAGSFADRL
ncbi:MAG TPA: hypothetical protein VKX49_30585 [Bryobacteraceae bacterium]|nr:hypothetical protein [Bryobacteraceae bacterium]